MSLIDFGILYVEDEPSIAKRFTSLLSRAADPVYTADNAKEALALFETHQPLIVITDIKMAGDDGIWLAKRIKEQRPSTRIIITTAHSDADYFLRAIEAGVDRFYLKPVDFEALHSYLSQLQKEIQTQKRLEHTQHLLRQYQRAIDASTIIAITDPRGIFKYVNNKYCESSGFSREELIGKPHSLTRHPVEQKEKFQKLWESISNKKMWRGTIRNKRKDGRSFYVDTTIIPMLNDDGEIFEYISLQNDITKEIEQEEELQRIHAKELSRHLLDASEINYARFVRQMPLPAILSNAEEKILAISDTLAEKLSLTAVPKRVWDIIKKEDTSLFGMTAMDLGLPTEGLSGRVELIGDDSIQYQLVRQSCGEKESYTIWYLIEKC